MGLKIKRMACIAVAFDASFMLTVTAYSATLADGDIYNPRVMGKYTNNVNDGYIWAKEGNVTIYTYQDTNYNCYVTASYSAYTLGGGSDGFFVIFPYAAKVDINGNVLINDPRIQDYVASGRVTVPLFGSVSISSFQSSLTYVK